MRCLFTAYPSLRQPSLCNNFRGFGSRIRAKPLPIHSGKLMEDLAYAILKPKDPNHTSSILQMLNPFKTIRRGPDVFSLVTVSLKADGESDLELSSTSEFRKKLIGAEHGQDLFRGGALFSVGHIKRSNGHRGASHLSKLMPGTAVVANFDLHGDPFATGALVGAAICGSDYIAQQALSFNANLKQGYGTIVKVHEENGTVISADVSFHAAWCQDWNSAVKLHYHTGDGFYANITADRIIAHASFRNIFLNTTLDYLQWEFSVLLPESVPLDDVKFIDVSTGALVSTRTPKNIRDLLEGSLALEISGRRVPVLDPALSVTPKAVNSRVAALCGGGFLVATLGLASSVLALCPLGLLMTGAGCAVQVAWNRHAKEQRVKFKQLLDKE